MATIERRQIVKTEYETVPVEVLNLAIVPVWLSRGECDHCKFSFEAGDVYVTAARIYGRGSGDLLFLHSECAKTAIKQ